MNITGPETHLELQSSTTLSSNGTHMTSSNRLSKSSKEKVTIDIPEGYCGRNHCHQESDDASESGGYYNEAYCRTFVAFIFVFLSMISNLAVLAVVHERVPMDITHPLPDLGFDVFPRVDRALDIAEYIIIAETIGVVVLLFLHRYRQLLFRRIALIMGILYLFRAVCMISTVFPLANDKYHCSPQLFNRTTKNSVTTGEYVSVVFERVFKTLLGFGLSINGRHTYCGDYLYSGHTVTLTLGYLILREYLLPSRCRTFLWKLFNVITFMASCTGVIAIIVARGHYLIDILIAYYISTRVFWMYHTIVYNHNLIQSSPTNYLARVWWFPLLRYFECIPHDRRRACETQSHPICSCDCPVTVIPRSFEWPLPWPRCLRRRTLLPYQQRLLPASQA